MKLASSHAARRTERRLAIALAVSLLLHGVALLLQYGVPGIGTPGTPPPLTVRLASVDVPVPVPAPALEPTPADNVPPPPHKHAAPPAAGMRLVDPVAAPTSPPASIPKTRPRPTVRKDKPRRARRVSTPMPARDVQLDSTPVIAQDTALNDFAMPVARPEEAEEKSVDLQAAREGEDEGDADSAAAAEAQAAAAGKAKADMDARLAEQRLLDARLAEEKLEAERLAQERMASERDAERQRMEQQALAQRAAEQKAAEQERLAQRQIAEQRIAEQTAAEQQRLSQQRLTEQKAVEEQQLAQQRLAEQKAAEQRRQSEQRVAQQKAADQKAAEQQRLAQEAAEQRRLAQQEQQRQQARAEQLAAERAGQLAAQRAREAASATAGSGSSDGLTPGPGGSGARGQLPRSALGSDLANRARDMVRGLDVLKGEPPGQLLRNDRRVAIGPNERDLPLKMYAESWRQKIERNSTVNYPRSWADGPPRDILVSVALRSDGTVEDVFIVQSSGVPEMDEAVRRIVRVNARYSPFPPAIAQRYDIIDVRRVWRFGDQLKLMEEVR